MISNIN